MPMKFISLKTFEPVQLPGDFTSFITITGAKKVDTIQLYKSLYFIVTKADAKVLIPIANVSYAGVEEEQPQVITEQKVSLSNVKQKAQAKSAVLIPIANVSYAGVEEEQPQVITEQKVSLSNVKQKAQAKSAKAT
jgi:DNA-binding LytR/AlgR family response regulator